MKKAPSYAIIVLVTGIISSCGITDPISVKIENKTQLALTHISVIFSDHTYEISPIQAGDSATVRGSPGRDGMLKLTYYRGGNLIEENITYISPGVGGNCRVEVSETVVNKQCKFG